MKKRRNIIIISISFVVILGALFLLYPRKVDSQKQFQSQTEHERKVYDNLFDIGNDNFIMCSSSNIAEGKSIEADLDNDGVNENLIIGLNHPNGFRVLGFKGEYGVHLLPNGCEGAYDEFGELNEGYFVQVSYVDLNNDGTQEVLVSLGNKLTEMVTAIYRIRDAEEDSYKLVGTIEGQDKMYLDGTHIIVPIGSQGLYNEYI